MKGFSETHPNLANTRREAIVAITSKILEIIGADRNFEPDLPYEESAEGMGGNSRPVYDRGVLIVQKMPNAPTERSVNRGGSGFRRGQTLHAIVLSDSLQIGRTVRSRREFLCSSANRSRGFDVFGCPESAATCPDCLAKIQKYSIHVETSACLSGYF